MTLERGGEGGNTENPLQIIGKKKEKKKSWICYSSCVVCACHVTCTHSDEHAVLTVALHCTNETLDIARCAWWIGDDVLNYNDLK